MQFSRSSTRARTRWQLPGFRRATSIVVVRNPDGVPTATFRVLCVFVVLTHDRRRIVHVNVTAHPTAAWTAQQLREAWPWASAPRFVL
jgi:hypothetical protein